MVKKMCSFVTGCLIFGVSISPSGAEPIPEFAIGIWSVSDCEGEGITVQVNSSSAILVESKETKTKVALAEAEWNAGNIVLIMENQNSDIVLPSLDGLRQCDVLSGRLSVMFAEAVAIFKHLDRFDAHCKGKDRAGRHCLEVISNMIDISGDGAVSQAEISRLLRATSFFIGYRLLTSERSVAFVPLEDMFIIQLTASTLGPYIADNLIASYDYDGDGKLSIQELTQDRGEDEGVTGIFSSEVSDMAPEIWSVLLEWITELF